MGYLLFSPIGRVRVFASRERSGFRRQTGQDRIDHFSFSCYHACSSPIDLPPPSPPMIVPGVKRQFPSEHRGVPGICS